MNKIVSPYPLVLSTVDILGYFDDKILVGKKPNEEKYCLIGGFVDPELDNSRSEAAIREFKEETKGLNLINIRHRFSTKVDDPRYRDTPHKIFTDVYEGDINLPENHLLHTQDEIKGDLDDLELIKLICMFEFFDTYQDIIVDRHIPILKEYFDDI